MESDSAAALLPLRCNVVLTALRRGVASWKKVGAWEKFWRAIMLRQSGKERTWTAEAGNLGMASNICEMSLDRPATMRWARASGRRVDLGYGEGRNE